MPTADSTEELQKKLTAAVAYNRFMEKRVAFLEHQLKQIASQRETIAAQHNLVLSDTTMGSHPGSPTKSSVAATPAGSPSSGKLGALVIQVEAGSSPTSPLSPVSVSTASPLSPTQTRMQSPQSLIDENIKLKMETKRLKKEQTALQQKLKLTEANMKHAASKDKQKSVKIKQLMDEVRSIRELLPENLQGDALTHIGGSTVVGCPGDVGGSMSDNSSLVNPGSPTRARREHTTPFFQSVPIDGVDDATTILSDIGDDDEDDGAFDRMIDDLGNGSFPTNVRPGDHGIGGVVTPPDGLLSKQQARGGAESILGTIPVLFDAEEVQNFTERSQLFDKSFGLLRNVLAYSKKRTEDDAIGAALLQFPSSDAKKPKHHQDLNVVAITTAIEKVCRDLTDMQHAVKAHSQNVANYQAKQRNGITQLVECQSTPQGGLIATSLSSKISIVHVDLNRIRTTMEDNATKVSQKFPKLLTEVMECCFVTTGIGLYKNHPHIVYFLDTLMALVVRLLTFDADHVNIALSGECYVSKRVETQLEGAASSRAPPRLSLQDLRDMSTANNQMSTKLPAVAEGAELIGSIRSGLTSLRRVLNGEIGLTDEASGVKGDGGNQLASHLQCKGTQVNFTQKLTDDQIKLKQLASVRHPYYECLKDAAPSPTRTRSRSRSRSRTPGGSRHAGRTPTRAGSNSSLSPAKSMGPGGFAAAVALSGPLHRGVYDHQTSTMDHVDRMLADAAEQGLPFPPNFARDRSGGVNRFVFGTRRITFEISGGELVTHIGGGYITLRELCGKYTPLETQRLETMSLRGHSSRSPARAAGRNIHNPTSSAASEHARTQRPQRRKGLGHYQTLDQFLNAVDREKTRIDGLRRLNAGGSSSDDSEDEDGDDEVLDVQPVNIAPMASVHFA